MTRMKVSIDIEGLCDYGVTIGSIHSLNPKTLFIVIKSWVQLQDDAADYKWFFQRLERQLNVRAHELFGKETIMEQSISTWDGGEKKDRRKCYTVELTFMPTKVDKVKKAAETYNGKINSFVHYLNSKFIEGKVDPQKKRHY